MSGNLKFVARELHVISALPGVCAFHHLIMAPYGPKGPSIPIQCFKVSTQYHSDDCLLGNPTDHLCGYHLNQPEPSRCCIGSYYETLSTFSSFVGSQYDTLYRFYSFVGSEYDTVYELYSFAGY